MIERTQTRARCASVLLWACVAPFASAQYEPPVSYYDTAAGTGATLKGNLHLIASKDYWNPASTTHRFRSYDVARQGLWVIDRDQSDSSKIILFYTGNSVAGTWDAGATWNREHTWPVSLQGGGESGPDYSDLHMLRPCDPGTNGSRGNKPYGVGSGFYDPLAAATVPGANHRGDAARAMFYMDMRYDGGDSSTVDLAIVNGFPGAGQMGDLVRMVEWHFTDPIDEYERRRNATVFSNVLNPSYYQGNRNPFVDRPEFVWAIWGSAPNTSTLFVGATPGADGSSSDALTLRALVGAPVPQQTLTVNKTGATPTTYDLILSGPFTVDAFPQGRAFISNTQQQVFTISAESTATPGLSLGLLTVDNTDLTSAGPGQGNADADDIITVMVDVLTHAVASWDAGSLVTSTVIEAESVPFGPTLQIDIPVHNLGGGPAQASLDVDAVLGLSGPFSALAPLPTSIGATPGTLSLLFDPTGLSPGVYSVITSVSVSDEDLPGALNGSISLTVEVTVPSPCFGNANGDGVVDFNDITEVLANWLADYAPGTGSGDANYDGVVDFNDIAEVLANWLSACE